MKIWKTHSPLAATRPSKGTATLYIPAGEELEEGAPESTDSPTRIRLYWKGEIESYIVSLADLEANANPA